MISVCCICTYNVQTSDGKWVVLDVDLKLFPDVIMVSHGICPDCIEEYTKKSMEEMKRMNLEGAIVEAS